MKLQALFDTGGAQRPRLRTREMSDFLMQSDYGGQIYPVPLGFLKQPTDSGSSSFGR